MIHDDSQEADFLPNPTGFSIIKQIVDLLLMHGRTCLKRLLASGLVVPEPYSTPIALTLQTSILTLFSNSFSSTLSFRELLARKKHLVSTNMEAREFEKLCVTSKRTLESSSI